MKLLNLRDTARYIGVVLQKSELFYFDMSYSSPRLLRPPWERTILGLLSGWAY